ACWVTNPMPRLPAGVEMPAMVSSRGSRSILIRPAWGAMSPARMRSSVLLPAPEGPKMTVHCDSSAQAMSRVKAPWCKRAEISTMAEGLAGTARVEQEQGCEGEAKQEERGSIRGGVREVL